MPSRSRVELGENQRSCAEKAQEKLRKSSEIIARCRATFRRELALRRMVAHLSLVSRAHDAARAVARVDGRAVERRRRVARSRASAASSSNDRVRTIDMKRALVDAVRERTNEGERRGNARSSARASERGKRREKRRRRGRERGDGRANGLTRRASERATQGVDVSDCFERADLEVKYSMLLERDGTRRGRSEGRGRGEEREARAEASSEEAKTSWDGNTTGEARKSMFSDAQRFVKEALDGVKSKMSVEAIRDAIREKANRVNAKYGTGTKAQEYLDDVRRRVSETDSKLGVTKWFKVNVPKALKQYDEVRATPVGKFANFMFWIWLFTSGIFWNLFYFAISATFLVNLLMPSLISDQVENLRRRAQEQMSAQGGFDPRAGGMGGMGGSANMGGMGGAPRGAPRGRTSYGGNASPGDTIDVDAKVSDRD